MIKYSFPIGAQKEIYMSQSRDKEANKEAEQFLSKRRKKDLAQDEKENIPSNTPPLFTSTQYSEEQRSVDLTLQSNKKEKFLFTNTPPLFHGELSRENSFIDKEAPGSPYIPPSGIVDKEYFTQDFLPINQPEPALLPGEPKNKRNENFLQPTSNIDMVNDFALTYIENYNAPIIGDSPTTTPPKNGGDVSSPVE